MALAHRVAALVCTMAVMGGSAYAADLSGLPENPPFVIPAPVPPPPPPPTFVVPVPLAAVPIVVAPPPIVAAVLPFFVPVPPPPPPSYTLFSEPDGFPPRVRINRPTPSASFAEDEHYGYGVAAPPPRPLGFYGPGDVD